MKTKRHALAVAALIAGAGITGVGACSMSTTSSCAPARLRADPATVAPGGTVRLHSPAADCDLGLGEHATYRVAVIDRHRQVRQLGRFPVAQDGTFDATVTIPRRVSPGRATLDAVGNLPCDDTASCAAYDVRITVRSG